MPARSEMAAPFMPLNSSPDAEQGQSSEEKHVFSRQAAVPRAFAIGGIFGATVALLAVHALPLPQAVTTLCSHSSFQESEPYVVETPPSVVPRAYMEALPLNNSCLIQNLDIPSGPQTFDACGFIIRSTDEVWNLRGDVDAAIEKYFHDEYLNAGSWGGRMIGKRALRNAIYAEMRAFSDIQIHITDCVCKGNDNDGYKCAMPDVLTGTNNGPSAYGPATHRYARWTGMVQSFVKKNPATGQWQYYAEWGVHDEWALIQQLGLDFKRVPHPLANLEPIHDCVPLQRWGAAGQVAYDSQDAAAQQTAASSGA